MKGCRTFHRDEAGPEARDIFTADAAAAFAANHAEEAGDFEHVEVPTCPACGAFLRPDVVWFGEMLPADRLNQAFADTERCDLFLVIGTSAQVQPAASLPVVALEQGVPVVEINPNATPLTEQVTLSIRAAAGEILSSVV